MEQKIETLKHEVMLALEEVVDPEMQVDVVNLGLIYDLTISENGEASITYSLTSPACPSAGWLAQNMADAASSVAGITAVELSLTFTPFWTAERVSEEGCFQLGIGY